METAREENSAISQDIYKEEKRWVEERRKTKEAKKRQVWWVC